MTRLGKFWTASIAYVALAVGAGLSIMYNVLDTAHVRGPAFDWADLVTAVAAPGIVLLMVEMFVSRIWDGQRWQIQVIRWMATLAIGGVAMLASWTHGHDFMASRGQTVIVATAWPLAIDLLAIMATALILAGRRGQMATGQNAPMVTVSMANGGEVTGQWPEVLEVAKGMATGHVATEDPGLSFGGGHGHSDLAMATQPDDPTVDIKAALANWDRGYDEAIADLGHELATEAEALANGAATTKLPSRVPVVAGVPDEARELLLAWDPAEVDKADVDALLVAHFGKSLRTVRRWRSIVSGNPVSGA